MESVKYLRVKIDTNLSWQCHVNDLSIKLNRANALLFKMRKYVSLKILRSIYFLLFLTPTYLTAVLFGLRIVALLNKLWFYKKRQLELLIFNQETPIPVPYSNKTSSLKFQDKICLENILFVSKSLNNLTLSVFGTRFSFSSDQHNYETSSSTLDNLTKIFYKKIDMGSIQSL